MIVKLHFSLESHSKYSAVLVCKTYIAKKKAKYGILLFLLFLFSLMQSFLSIIIREKFPEAQILEELYGTILELIHQSIRNANTSNF